MSITTLSFVKNFSSPEASKFYLSNETGFREASAQEVCATESYIVTHDYWMICRDIYEIAGELPKKVIDLDEFQILASRDTTERKKREKFDVIERINRVNPATYEICQKYKKVFYGEVAADLEIIKSFHELLVFYYVDLCRIAYSNGEFQRFIDIEVPCHEICALMSSRGIKVDNGRISTFRQQARHEYYTSLKEMSDKFDVPLEVPSNKDIELFSASQGVDLQEYSFDFVLNFIPQVRDYCEAVQNLRDLDHTRGTLNSIAIKDNRVHPVLDTQGSRTSRISARNPFLQSLAKKYRSILTADDGYELGYVDFDQFEVGIMAALSQDPELHRLFSQPDMYESFRVECLNSEGDRKAAKTLFLAYAYGMKLRNLPIVGANFGVSRKTVRNAFKKFGRYEKWKQETLGNFEYNGFVTTSLGNRFYMQGTKATKKEKLSAISQVVQGEGSLIFKKALISAQRLDAIEMLLPMHDALLFQTSDPDASAAVVEVFTQVINKHFEGAISGKASMEPFSGME